MSSSGSRGPPSNRYNDKRKGFYNPRRSLGSAGSNYNSNGISPNSSNGPSSTGASSGASASGSNEYSNSNPVPSGRRYNSSSGYAYSSYTKYNNNSNGYYSNYGSYSASNGDSSSFMGGSSSDSPSFYSRPALNNRNSLSNSIPKRDRSRNNSLLNSKRSDTYYPSKPYFNKSQVDHYSTKKKYLYGGSNYNNYYDSSPNNFYSYKKSGYNSNYNDSYGTGEYSEGYSGNTLNKNGNLEKYNSSEGDVHASRSKDDNKFEHNEPDVSKLVDHSELENGEEFVEGGEEEEFQKEEKGDDDNADEPHVDIIEKDDDEIVGNIAHDDAQEIHLDNEDDLMRVDSPIPDKNLDPGKDLKVDDTIKPEITGSETEYKYPLTRIDALYEDLKQEFDSQSIKSKHPKVIQDIKQYPFYYRNIRLFQQKKPRLVHVLSQNLSNIKSHKLKLWKEYKNWENLSMKESKNMEEQLKYLHPPNDDMKKDLESADIRIKPDGLESPVAETNPNSRLEGFENTSVTGGFGSRRASRRHGDSVTTEAEFEEVLKNLSKQDDEDPMLKALKVSAKVPDLLFNKYDSMLLHYLDANNIVKDKAKWASRVRTQFFDNFSPEEHQLFCDGFVKYPKKFGYISRYMGGLRTFGECVIHYYLTKKAVNYKNLLMQYKKKNTKKVQKKKVKSRNESVNMTEEDLKSIVNSESMEQESSETVDLPMDPIELAQLIVDENKKKRPVPSTNEVSSTKRVHIEIKPSVKPEEVKEPESPVQTQHIEVKKKPRKKKEDESISNINKDGNKDQEESKDQSKKVITSYWSITETNAFPLLLKEHGTKWTTIADKLATKTATMVRNYFQRNAEKNNWIELAQEADKMLEKKFAAVLSKPDPESNNNIDANETSQSPIEPKLDQQNGAVLNETLQGISNHSSSLNPVVKMETETHKPTIMNLLNAYSPTKTPASPVSLPPPVQPVEPKRNNINSLLNSSSSGSNETSDKPFVSSMPKLSAILTDNDDNS